MGEPLGGSPLPGMPPATRRKRTEEPRWATSSDWQTWRYRIEELYQSHKLKDVISAMEAEGGFRATIKMYKQRLTAWNVRKYKTKRLVTKQVYRCQRIREIQPSKLLTYLSWPTLKEEQTLGEAALSCGSKFTSMTFQSNNDPPTNSWMQTRQYSHSQAENIHQRHRFESSSIGQRPPQLSILGSKSDFTEKFSTNVGGSLMSKFVYEYEIYDSLLLSIKYYVASGLCSASWQHTAQYIMGRKADTITNGVLKSFGRHVMAANHLITMGETKSAEFELISSTTYIKTMLQSQDPELLCTLLRLMYMSRLAYWAFRKILEQIANLAEIVLGKPHPLTQIALSLSLMKPAEYDEVITMLFEATTDQFAKQVGEMHPFVLTYRLEYLKVFAVHPHTSDIAKTLMRECEMIFDKCDERFIRVQLGLGWNYHDQHYFLAARALAHDLLGKASTYLTEDVRNWNFRHAYKLLAYSEKGLGNVRAAEMSYKKHMSHVLAQDGEQSGNFVRALVVLESWYVGWGMAEKILNIKKRRTELQISMQKLV